MTTEEILRFKSVQYWLEGLSKTTKRNYMKYFPPWLKHTKEKLGTDNPDKLIAMRMQDLKSDDRRQRKRFEHIAKVWYHEIYDRFEKEGKSTGHAINHLKTVMSFFSRNDVALKFRRGELKQPKKKIKRIFVEIEDLKTAYTMLDVRDKALFTTLLQTGLSEIDVCALNIEDILEQLDNPPAYIEGYREKTTIRYQTCIGADACVAIKKYLTLRGEPQKGALFVTKFDERMTPRSVRDALKPVEKIIPHFKPKMLRDFYHDTLERANIKEALATRMFGHKVAGVKGEYLFAPQTVKMAYQKAYPLLKINDVTRATSREKSIADLVLRLGEIVSVIATEGQQQGIWALAELINDLKGREETPETPIGRIRKGLSEGTLRVLTEEQRNRVRETFNETLRRYLKSV